MLQNKTQVETVKMSFFGICFLLYFFKLSAGHGFQLMNNHLNKIFHIVWSLLCFYVSFEIDICCAR